MAENSKIGYLIRSARLRGMTVDEFSARVEVGQKYCSRCRDWHHASAFGADRSNRPLRELPSVLKGEANA